MPSNPEPEDELPPEAVLPEEASLVPLEPEEEPLFMASFALLMRDDMLLVVREKWIGLCGCVVEVLDEMICERVMRKLPLPLYRLGYIRMYCTVPSPDTDQTTYSNPAVRPDLR